jgi:hypothetical protein
MHRQHTPECFVTRRTCLAKRRGAWQEKTVEREFLIIGREFLIIGREFIIIGREFFSRKGTLVNKNEYFYEGYVVGKILIIVGISLSM